MTAKGTASIRSRLNCLGMLRLRGSQRIRKFRVSNFLGVGWHAKGA